MAVDRARSASRPSLAERLRRDEPTTGLIVKLPCQRAIEMAGAAGFDYLVIDCEHGPRDGLTLDAHLALARALGMPALVRITALEEGDILQALDAGAAGIVVPHVADAAAAARAVAAVHYPPLGRRSFARSTRAAGFGTRGVGEHLEASEAETCVVVQIEDQGSLAAVKAIAAVPGVDALFVGTADLAVESGWWRSADGDARLDAAVQRVAAAAAEHGLGTIAPLDNRASATRWRRCGIASLVAVETSVMLAALRECVRAADATAMAGESEPVVLLPGMLCDDRLWAGVRAELGEHRTTIVPRLDLDTSVGEIAETVLTTAPARFALAGHSLGAVVALEVARRAPHRVTRLALVNASARPPAADRAAAWEAMEAAVGQGEFRALAAGYPDEVLPTKRREDAELRGTVTTMANGIGSAGLLRQLSAQRSRTDMRHSLAELTCPVLAVAGAEDGVTPPELGAEIADAAPAGELCVLDGCGHMAPLEAPVAVAGALRRWLGAGIPIGA